ncbi:PREDICTED: uncharacterized protein LOC106749168 [Dinoponera quadriceps]|uniref:Uncharacterized protein LOC106749168 n=1 Tax=Dinoponera quadriceps TaxID=609295 RepID=A0A6P3Y0G9_DINQU|nr:PREDICTED: uncharacterized protein LOC106749168 [Dinoponera quadriceps]
MAGLRHMCTSLTSRMRERRCLCDNIVTESPRKKTNVEGEENETSAPVLLKDHFVENNLSRLYEGRKKTTKTQVQTFVREDCNEELTENLLIDATPSRSAVRRLEK